MSRPLYETQKDVDSERKVMDHITSMFRQGVLYSKLPKAYQVDYGVYDKVRRGRLLMLCEIKTRDINRNTYPDLILSAHKMHALINWHTRGVPTRLLYRVNDGLFSYSVTDAANDLVISEGGRKDRNDWQDIEPVYHIPTDQLVRVEGWKNSETI